MFRILFLTLATLGLTAGMPLLAASPAAKHAHVYIISPTDGARVTSPVTVRFGLKGMGVAPAGVDKKYTGHHHLLIDVKKLPNFNRPIPSDAHHRHFGGGQTEVSLKLSRGKHRLQLILGDKNHIPHHPVVLSKAITIFVK